MTALHFICSFPDKQFEHFGLFYIQPHKKHSMRKNDVPVPVDDSKRCPLEVYYDADVHDALSNLRKLDGDIPVHPQYSMSVNFCPPKSRKYWTKPSTTELGYFNPYFLHHFNYGHYFHYCHILTDLSYSSPWIKLCVLS